MSDTMSELILLALWFLAYPVMVQQASLLDIERAKLKFR